LEINDLIAEVNALDIEPPTLKPSFIRKLAHDGVISSAPRYARSAGKGRGGPTNWSEDSVAEIAAFLSLRKMDAKGIHLPKRFIKHIKEVGISLRNAPWRLCRVGVAENAEFDLVALSEFVRIVRIGRAGELATDETSIEHIFADSDPEVARDLLFYKLRDVLDELLRQELRRKGRNPDSFNDSTADQLAWSIESINEFLHFFGKTSDPRDAERNYGVFKASREVAKWIATYEKVKLNLPLSTPLELWYLYNVDVTKKAAPEQQELELNITERDADQRQYQSRVDVDVHYAYPRLKWYPFRESETHEDQVLVQYDINLHDLSEESS
jgi:hypothetical protein